MTDDLYCKVYLTGVADRQRLEVALAQASKGVAGLSIDIFSNRHDPPLTPDDFVRWPFYLEIEPADPQASSFDAFLAALASVLTALRAQGLRTVASCDFETALNAAMS
jgi:hypothetical protein